MKNGPRPRIVAALAAVVASALLLSGCAPFGSPPLRTASSPAPETAPAGLERLYSQQLVWSGCGGGLQCTTTAAPLDWNVPDGDTVQLSIARRPAGTSDVRGSLLIDPGGPGASAIDYLRSAGSRVLGSDVLAHYDIVAVDPRGVGHSSPVDCVPDAQLDDLLYDPLPDPRGSTAWIDAASKLNDTFAAGCAARTGALLGHVDTVSVARDWDMVRALLGDAQLNYLGYSYGTLIGALYADLFPERVGRMVLDGALDPALPSFAVTLGQAEGFEDALTAYLKNCLGGDGCPFSGSVDSARIQVSNMLTAAEANPIRHGDGRVLTGSTLLTAVVYALYRDTAWPSLSRMFADVRSGSSNQAFDFADQYNDRTSAGLYTSNQMEAFSAVNCLDYPATSDPAIIADQNAQLAAAAPTVGPWWTFGDLGCQDWAYPATRTPASVSGSGAAPILVVGTTGDPATPYTWAKSLASQLESGHLITYEGTVHTAYGSSPCVQSLVDRFFIDGTLPPDGARC